jgi:hypothetical protein
VFNILFHFSYLRRSNNNHSHNFINVYYTRNIIIIKDQEKKRSPLEGSFDSKRPARGLNVSSEVEIILFALKEN